MLVNIKQTFVTENRTYRKGENLDVPRELAAKWIADGYASLDTDGKLDDASTGSSTLAEIVARHTAARNNNARVNATIRSCELVSDTVYADSAALQTAFPASANANKGGKVVAGSGYVIQVSDGASWSTPTSGPLGFTSAAASTLANHTDYNLRGLTTNAVPENTWTAANNPFRLLGSMPHRLGASQFHAITHWFRDGTSFSRGSARLQFACDTPSPVITVSAPNTLSLVVDDGTGPKRVQDIAVSGSGARDVTLDLSQLGGRKRRTITVLFGSSDTGAIITVKLPNNTSLYTLDKRPPQIVMLTDSLGSTVKNGVSIDAFPSVVSDYLGCEVYAFTEGSTGYTTRGDGPSTKTAVPERIAVLQSMPTYIRPTLGVFAAGVNDAYTDRPALTAAVVDAITKWQAAFPNAPLIVLGPWTGSGSTNIEQSVLREGAIQSAVAQFDQSKVRFIPTMGAVPPYLSGSGNTSAVANNGNADLVLDTGDQVHWNTYGHTAVMGPRVAEDIVTAVRSLAGLS